MDINDFRGLLTLVMLVAFLGLVRWAWHAARKPDFERAANLPLTEDSHPLPPEGGRAPGARGDATHSEGQRT
jgi:cytochrome c oxidase cbb3-type subunit 4